MGFKNTIEIITKDIQELEKMVSNFENYSRIPAIELDLALEKIRNLYDLLLLMKEHEKETSGKISDSSAAPPPPTEKKAEPRTEEKKEMRIEKEEDKGNERIEYVNEEKTQEVPADPPQQKSTPPQPEKPASGEEEGLREKIIAEKFKKTGDFLNEKIGSGKSGNDLSSKIQAKPIKSIPGSMGINDKFFFIRELFNGNAENFNIAMRTLDDASDFSEAQNYLQNTFDWDMDSEAVQQLLNLIRRKFIHSSHG